MINVVASSFGEFGLVVLVGVKPRTVKAGESGAAMSVTVALRSQFVALLVMQSFAEPVPADGFAVCWVGAETCPMVNLLAKSMAARRGALLGRDVFIVGLVIGDVVIVRNIE